MRTVIDCDQHLYEPRSLWSDFADPPGRDEALSIVDDDLGYAWLSWRGRRLQLADVQLPGDTDRLGAHRNRLRAGRPADYSYDEALPADYWHPDARAARLDTLGVAEAVLFPNFGLLWERALSDSLPAVLVNMGAWNRWCAEVSASGGGRLHPVGHVTLRDAVWLDAQLGALSRAGVRMAMVAPAPVDGRPLSHRDLDAVWGAFVEHGVTPTFHVADQPHAFDAGWYADVPTEFVSPLDSVMLSTPPALAVTDLVVNGVFARHPDLRVGVVELGATWVPHYLRMLDGGWAFTSRINGRVPWPLDGMPSDYVRRHVRVAAFSYEDPQRLIAAAGDVFMACSDYPHAEGTATPVADYEGRGVEVGAHDALFRDNAAFLLHAADGGRVAPPASAADTGWLATRNR